MVYGQQDKETFSLGKKHKYISSRLVLYLNEMNNIRIISKINFVVFKTVRVRWWERGQ